MVLILTALFLYSLNTISTSQAAPLTVSGNGTDVEVLGYVSDPNGRGTLSLVLSCLLTLLLCVWSALHLNVPAANQTKVQCLRENIQWIVIGIYAPELVVFTAWRQWSSARILDRQIKEIEDQQVNRKGSTSSNNSSSQWEGQRRHKWTKTHSFFACTGGFAFQIDHSLDSDTPSEESYLPEHCPRRLTLTARGMAFLAQCGHLPDVPEEDILDKSKGNGMAKALVVMQAVWMLIQVGGRLATRLPVTLLEVNTVAHVLCALLMYALWWYKPLLPNEPIILQGEWVDRLCSYMLICSQVSGEPEAAMIESETSVKKMFTLMQLYSKTPEIECLCLTTAREEASNGDAADSSFTFANSQLDLKLASVGCRQHIKDLHQQSSGNMAFFERRPRLAAKLHHYEAPTRSTIQRWKLATEAISLYSILSEERILEPQNSSSCIHLRPEELLVPHVKNWPSEDLLRDVGGLTVGMMLWFSNFVYGGLHTAAWNEYFPSIVEQWLWRSSSLYIGFCGGLWVVLNYAAHRYKPLNEFWETWMNGRKRIWHNLILGTAVIICGSSFCFARLFIVLEAFLSIRQLPKEAYDTPAWSEVFPHL